MSLDQYHRALRIKELFARFHVEYIIPHCFVPSEYRHLHPQPRDPIPVLRFTTAETAPSAKTHDAVTSIHPIPRVADAVLEKAEWADEHCPITHEPFRRGHVRCTSCYHCFQEDAFLEWMKTHKTCPVCRTECTSIRL